MRTTLTLGTNFYPAQGGEGRRQQAAQDSWRLLPGVDLVDVQFARDPARLDLPGFRRVDTLRRDSRELTGVAGKRKPLMSELFDALAHQALAAGHERFAFANADIVLGPSFVETVRAGAAAGSRAQVFSRVDFPGEIAGNEEMIFPGQDVFVLDVRWWLDNRWRFRPYIIGEVGWDNVYTSILLRHAPGARLHNRVGHARHEIHENAWYASPFEPYNTFLITLDSYYFRDWCEYCGELRRLRGGGLLGGGALGDEAAEAAAQLAAYSWRPDVRARLVHWGRVTRAYARLWGAGLRRGRARLPERRSTYAPA